MTAAERDALRRIRSAMAAAGEAPDELTDEQLYAAIVRWLWRWPNPIEAAADMLAPEGGAESRAVTTGPASACRQV